MHINIVLSALTWDRISNWHPTGHQSHLLFSVQIQLQSRGARRGKLRTRKPPSFPNCLLKRYVLLSLTSNGPIFLASFIRSLCIHTCIISSFLFLPMCYSLSTHAEKSKGSCYAVKESWCTLLRNAQCEKQEQEQEQRAPSISHRRPKGQTIKALDRSYKNTTY